MGKIPERYLHVITIVHGKSEFIICKHVRSTLNIKSEIIGRDNGESSIQVNGVMKFLNTDSRFKTEKGFNRSFQDIQKDKKKIIKLKIFIIMDTDDCDEETKNAFINKSMFKNHFLFDYIEPIYNTPNLEAVMKAIKKNVENKKDYIKIFPINHDNNSSFKELKEIAENLKRCKKTNLENYINYCFEVAEKELNR